MSLVLAGGVACAVFVVLAGLLVGRGMTALDRHAEFARIAPAGRGTDLRRGAVGRLRAPAPGCRCGRGDCLAPDPRGELAHHRTRVDPR